MTVDVRGAITLRSEALEATFLPRAGMLGISLRHRGEELLRRIDTLGQAAADGKTAGLPLLYPYANRLASRTYRAAGKEVTLDAQSSLLSRDEHGLLIHGVRWSMLAWNVRTAADRELVADLDWNEPRLLALFPYRHRLQLAVSLGPDRLTIETSVIAEERLPVSFGFHPYHGLPRLSRGLWRLSLPAMQRLVLDEQRIPTGAKAPFPGYEAPLGDWDCDAGFVLPALPCEFSISGGGRRIALEFLHNFPYAQVFAPRGKAFICFEPMTAPANALVSGCALPLVEPGATFRAAFAIRVESLPAR
jgi:aldose 1-epimerase